MEEDYGDLRQFSPLPAGIPSPSSVASASAAFDPRPFDVVAGKVGDGGSGTPSRNADTNHAAAALYSSISSIHNDRTGGGSARSRIDAILAKSSNKQSRPNDSLSSSPPPNSRSLSRPRWEQQATADESEDSLRYQDTSSSSFSQLTASSGHITYRETSLLDADEIEVCVDEDDGILLDDNIQGGSSANKTNNDFPSPPPPPQGSRVHNYGLVSILKGCTDCGASDYLYEMSTTDTGDASSPNRRRRRFFYRGGRPPTSPDRTIASRVSFSEELAVRELPRMSSDEKSRRFYTARELQTIRKDAREEHLKEAERNDDCNFFCGDFYDAFCEQELCAGETEAWRAGDVLECGSDRFSPS
eukprot:CAMPEP_0181044556 /NCGR_PEP_ID=MMETSP1070-20121207/13329_1 /TAXON_ID=265543 /ORGANISM="Minutocellus polymorphus, Strain NH13" /LENGTH=357 /DNA_ID=CAMNT_0023123009 /DNA_START=156 /DNA_END=1226 /DNA_ORIENTATION=+